MSKSKLKKLAAILGAIVLGLIMILVGVFTLGRKNPTEDQQPVRTEALATEEIFSPETQETVIQETAESIEAVETESIEIAPLETVSESNKGNNNQSIKPSNTQKPQKEPDKTIRFPYTIPDADLVIEQVNSYNGIFFEDGSDKEVSNVAAIVLTNKGKSCIEYASITIKCGTTHLRFVGSSLKAGGTMIVLEAEGKNFENSAYTDCTSEIAYAGQMVMSENLVRVEEHENGGLLVTNLSGEDIPCVRIFYKYYMGDLDVYVGGITYAAKVLDLPAGGNCIVTPSHYYSGYSTIVMVKTYDTKE